MSMPPANAAGHGFEGQLLVPGDDGYDDCRAVWNAMVDRRPRMIARCSSVGDVVAAVRTARELGLQIGVRCGGHSVLGLAVPDDGFMIDLTPMGAVRVDPQVGRAWVQGGALLGALDVAAQAHGLATTAGNVSHTGVGGLTLGGGMGWLARQHGLSCDNVVSFEVVTASGDVMRASARDNPDLYWGLRGGGGNFGIVTEFEFRLHETVPQAFVAGVTFPLDQGRDVLRGWRDLNAEAPRRATFTAFVGSTPDGGAALTAGYVWVGDPHESRRLLPALRSLGRPVAEEVIEPTYLELQTREDTPQGHAIRRYWKGHYLQRFDDEVIDAFLLRGSENGTGPLLPNVSLQAYGGAIADVPDDATAFSHRRTVFEFVSSSGWSDAGEDAGRIAAGRRCGAGLAPFASGAYVNVLTDEGAEGVRRAYPPAKLARLTALKDVYDPDNVFRLNQNIPPSTMPS
jgi:hypothetical protein